MHKNSAKNQMQSDQKDLKKELVELKRIYNEKKYSEVLKVTEKLSKIYPKNEEIYLFQANAYLSDKKYAQAVSSFQKIYSLDKNYPLISYFLGYAELKKGDLETAVKHFHDSIKENSKYDKTWFYLGKAQIELGYWKDAKESLLTSHKLNSKNSSIIYNLALALIKCGEYKLSSKYFSQFITYNPEHYSSWFYFAEANRSMGLFEAALKGYQKALSINPKSVRSRNLMGLMLLKTSKIENAVKFLQEATKLHPNEASLQYNLGLALQKKSDFENALKHYQQALKINPKFLDALYNVAHIFQITGKKNLAVHYLEKVLSINPIHTKSHFDLSNIKKYKRNDIQIEAMKKILLDKSISSEDKIRLNFALAKSSEDLNQTEQAWKYLKTGNSIKKKIVDYSSEKDKLLFEKLKLTAQNLPPVERFKSFNTFSRPIFILGMPRSGTTLVEQIISSHPRVFGAGELAYLQFYGHRLAIGEKKYSSETIKNFRQNYLGFLTKVSSKAEFVTDKVPQNFLYISLIIETLPEAKIIHVKRDPAATIWSNYKNNFEGTDVGYACDLEDTKFYYHLYKKLMLFWDEKYKGKIYHLDYEKLVENQNYEIKNIKDYLGLEWNEACLRPHENKRVVDTASLHQVREKIYKGSSKEWMKYKRYLKNIFNDL